jgi:hypothetical protein
MCSRFFCVIHDKELAEITLITFTYFLTLRLSALVVGTGFMECTIKTTPYISVTLRADFMPSYHFS